MFRISAVSIPVFAVISPALSAALAMTLFTSGVIALLTVWAAHAAFPDVGDSPTSAPTGAGPPRLPTRTAADAALRNTLIVMPVLIWYLVDEAQIAIVLLIVVVTVIRAYDPSLGQRAAVGLIIGNLVGGGAAALAHLLIQINDTLVFFVLMCLVAGLIFARLIVASGVRAPLYTVAFAAFLILLGIGVTPLPGGSGGAFVSRLLNVLLATAYTIGALSLLQARRGRAE